MRAKSISTMPVDELIYQAWKAGQSLSVSDIEFGPDHMEPLVQLGYQNYFALFAGLVRLLGARTILEFGTWHGSATFAFTRGWVDENDSGIAVTLDKSQPQLSRLAAIPGVVPMIGDPFDPRVMHRITRRFAKSRLDILYFDDPRHLYEAAIACVGSYSLLLNPRIIIIDDILRTTGMRKLWSDLQSRWSGRTININKLIPSLRPENCDLGLIDFRDIGEVK